MFPVQIFVSLLCKLSLSNFIITIPDARKMMCFHVKVSLTLLRFTSDGRMWHVSMKVVARACVC